MWRFVTYMILPGKVEYWREEIWILRRKANFIIFSFWENLKFFSFLRRKFSWMTLPKENFYSLSLSVQNSLKISLKQATKKSINLRELWTKFKMKKFFSEQLNFKLIQVKSTNSYAAIFVHSINTKAHVKFTLIKRRHLFQNMRKKSWKRVNGKSTLYTFTFPN